MRENARLDPIVHLRHREHLTLDETTPKTRKIVILEAPVRIENRAQLIYLLTEAAELEHGIMCCYLFAAFSMKRGVDEGITEEQLKSVRRCRRTILQISIE